MMKRRLPALASYLVLLLIVQTGCVASTEAPQQVSPTDTAAAGTTQESPPPPEIQVTEPFEERPFEELLPSLITPPDKPSLIISDEQEGVAAASIISAHTIAFIFPDGLVALKAAAATNPSLRADGLTTVGVVEMGPEAEILEPGTYVVAIDLESVEAEVPGRVIRGESGQDLTFERTALVRNPARQDSPSFPAFSPIISSHAVCFVVGLPDVLGKGVQDQPEISWFRYCSLAAVDTGQPILSVRDNYPAQFETLVGRWDESLRRLAGAGFPQDAQIGFSLTIAEMEGHPNINACNENNDCAADISGAPNEGFWEDYDQAKDEAGGNDYAVTAGIVRVERELDVPGQDLVRPGDYWVRVWFDGQEIFLGSSLLGVTDEGVVVPGQTIPSTPAYFLDAENPRTVVSWISAWRLCNWCMWQSNCP